MKNQKVIELLDYILEQVEDNESLLDIQDQLFKRGVETLLKSELKPQLGYEKGDKPIKEDVHTRGPKDRDNSFNPVTVAKHKTITDRKEIYE